MAFCFHYQTPKPSDLSLLLCSGLIPPMPSFHSPSFLFPLCEQRLACITVLCNSTLITEESSLVPRGLKWFLGNAIGTAEGFTLYFSFIKSLNRDIHSGCGWALSPDENLTSRCMSDESQPIWQRRPPSDYIRGDYSIRMRNSCSDISVCVWGTRNRDLCLRRPIYLPVLAVLQSVADLVFGLEQEVFESGRSLPANTQLVLQLTDTTDSHARRRVRGHWRKRRRSSGKLKIIPVLSFQIFTHFTGQGLVNESIKVSRSADLITSDSN